MSTAGLGAMWWRRASTARFYAKRWQAEIAGLHFEPERTSYLTSHKVLFA